MNKVDELLDDILGLNIEKTEHYEELTAEEMSRILKLSIERAGIQPKVIQKKASGRKKIYLLTAVIVAAAVFGLSMASARIADVFENMFGKNNNKYVNENGRIIGKSDSKNGITVKVKGVIGDNNNAWVIYDISKDNGEDFLSDDVRFAGIMFAAHESGGGNGDDNKISLGKGSSVTRAAEIHSMEAISGKEGKMIFCDLIDGDNNEALLSLDISKLLKKNPELIHQTTIKNPEVELGNTNEPVNILSKKGLNVPLSSHIPDSVLDNIGFVDGKLHMIIKSTMGDSGFLGRAHDFNSFEFKNKNLTLKADYGSRRGSDNHTMYSYFIYDIKNDKALKNFKLYVLYPNVIKGKWEVPIKMDYGFYSKKVKPDIPYDAAYNTKNRGIIKEVSLSPMALHVFITGNTYLKDGEDLGENITVFLKDGSEVVGGKSEGIQWENDKTIIDIRFFQLIDIDAVNYIMINGQKIKMDDK